MKGRLQISLEKAPRKENDSKGAAGAGSEGYRQLHHTIHAFCGSFCRKGLRELDPGLWKWMTGGPVILPAGLEGIPDGYPGEESWGHQSLVEIDIIWDWNRFLTLCMYPEVEVIRQRCLVPIWAR